MVFPFATTSRGVYLKTPLSSRERGGVRGQVMKAFDLHTGENAALHYLYSMIS